MSISVKHRRKNCLAVAKFSTNNSILINGKELDQYFNDDLFIDQINQICNLIEKQNITIKVQGSGTNSQCEAILGSIAKLFIQEFSKSSSDYLSNNDLIKIREKFELLKKYMINDMRRVESKKTGLHKARKAQPSNKR